MGHRNVEVKVEEVDYHRNGIGGEGFHIVKFQSRDEGDEEFQDMVGIVFEEAMTTAVFNRRLLGEGEIRFMHNSFRGDVFDPHLRAAIEQKSVEETRAWVTPSSEIEEHWCGRAEKHNNHFLGEQKWCPGNEKVL